MIGGVAADGGGDARMAIELLEESVRKAEMNGRREVLVGDVEEIITREGSLVSSPIEPNQIYELGRHQKLVLMGICRRLKKSEEISSGDARKLYELVCEEHGERPRGYTTFWKHMKQLEGEGLIQSRASGSNKGRGRTQYISMPNSAPAEIEARIERDMLSG